MYFSHISTLALQVTVVRVTSVAISLTLVTSVWPWSSNVMVSATAPMVRTRWIAVKPISLAAT